MKIEISQTALIAALIILAVDAAIFVLMYYTLGRAWRRNEDARKTSGITAVLLLALVAVPFGLMDLASWLFFCLLFAVAGATATSLKITEQARDRRAWEQERVSNGQEG